MHVCVVLSCCNAERKKLHEIDMAFAISARAVSSSANFKKMQDIINTIIDEYGSNKLHYSLVTFGDRPVVSLKFSEQFPGNRQLKSRISSVPRNPDSSSLDRALEVILYENVAYLRTVYRSFTCY